MSSLIIAFIIFACMLSGMLFGLRFRRFLPQHHTQDESKDIVKTATGMMATLVALIIGLLVSSAKGSFDIANAGITQTGAKIITLDYYLSHYGSEAKQTREQMTQEIASGIERIWPNEINKKAAVLANVEKSHGMEDVYNQIQALSPTNGSQQYLKSQALQLCADMMQSRWMLIEQSQNNLPTIFLIVLTFWLTVLFALLGLLTPGNLTTICTLVVCALSMSGAIFLILELNHPLEGIIKVSSAPLHKALDIIGK